MSSAPKNSKKITHYIDVDDEITGIIDKVVGSKEKIVALVLPKRATVMQSIVNVKLLKRSADEAHKKIVLITSDSGVIPLAGIAGVHVAKTLQSKPEVPEAPPTETPTEGVEEEVEIDKSKSLAELNGDNEETAEVPESPETSQKPKKKAGKKDKKFKIPNFNKFRIKLALVFIALILLIAGWVTAAKILPSADILVKTDTKTFNKQLEISAALNPPEEGDVIKASSQTLEKENSQTVPATGKKNVGDKAKGEMELTNCIDDDNSHTIPAGTGFTKNGKTFVTTKSVSLQESYSPDGECQGIDGFTRKNVDVVADEGGSSYNVSEGSYNSSIAGIRAYGSDMKGGTDDIVTVVSQDDIDKATRQFRDQTSEGSVDELKVQLTGQGYVPFESTFESADPNVNASQSPGDEAGSVTVNGTATFTMVGVLKEAIDEKIREASEEDIDNTAQSISDTGIDNATMRLDETSEGEYGLSVETLVTAGPQLDPDGLTQEILGKKYGETESLLSSKAGVVDVDIELSPFWVGSVPNNPDKVTITIENIAENEQ
ncbi:MAG: hypothetical protein U5L95_02765 [Candidatus Saccharibacteria bacterium]|nr:hypothetical protein [Candidatus Saccharibacteria bacterium]